MPRTVLAAILLLAGASPPAPVTQQASVVIFETDNGTIEMEVDNVRAPVTSANFLKDVDGGFYGGGSVKHPRHGCRQGDSGVADRPQGAL